MTSARMDKPVTLVTGASRGIGRAAAIELASRGHHIVALARTVGGLESLADAIGDDAVTLIPQDLSDGNALERLGPLLFDKLGRVDNLVANAGILGKLCPLAQTDPSAWAKIMAVNVTANLHLIRTLDPLLRHSGRAHAVFLTSGVAQNPRAYWGAYAASKAALESLAATYAAEAEGAGITVSVFNPGRTATAMFREAFPGCDPQTVNTPEAVAKRIADIIV